MPYIELGDFGGELGAGDVQLMFGNLLSGVATGKVFVIAGGTQGRISSENFDGATVPATVGWSLFGDGSVFLGSSVTVVGDIYSGNWDGTIPATSLPDAGASAGYYLDASAGDAQFQSIFAEGGEIGNLDILGNLTMSGVGNIRTAASGERVEIPSKASGDNQIKFYTSDGFLNWNVTGKISIMQIIGDGGDPEATRFHLNMDTGASDGAILQTKSDSMYVLNLEQWGAGNIQRWRSGDQGSQANVATMLADGTMRAKQFVFHDDTDNSFTITNPDQIAVYIGGTARWIWNTSLFTTLEPIRFPSGTAADPAVQVGQQGVGFYLKAANQIGVSENGAEIGWFAAGGWIGDVVGDLTGDISGDADTVDGFHGADLVAVTGDTMTGNLLLDNTADLYFKTQGAGIKSDAGTLMMGVNNSGLTYDNNLDYLPNWVATTAANITTGIVNNAYTAAITITIFDRISTNRSVRITAHGGMVFAYTGAGGPINVFSKIGISFDGGSTWSYGKNPDGFVGKATGGSGYRCQLMTQHGAEGTATGDCQVRLDYYVVGATDPTGIYGLTLEAEAHGIH